MALGKTPKDYPPAHCPNCDKITERTKGGVCQPCNTANLAKARASRTSSPVETGKKSWQTRKAKEAARLLGLDYGKKRNYRESNMIVDLAREKVAADAVVLFKRHAHAAADVLVKLLTAEDSRPEIKLQAAKEILDRSLGKAVQTNLVGSLDDSEVVRLTGQDIMAAARRLVSSTAIDAEPA